MWLFGCIILVSFVVSLHENTVLNAIASLTSKAKALFMSLDLSNDMKQSHGTVQE